MRVCTFYDKENMLEGVKIIYTVFSFELGISYF